MDKVFAYVQKMATSKTRLAGVALVVAGVKQATHGDLNGALVTVSHGLAIMGIRDAIEKYLTPSA